MPPRKKAAPKFNWILVCGTAGVVLVGLLLMFTLFQPRQKVENQYVIEEKESLAEKVGKEAIDIIGDEVRKELDEKREERRRDD